MVFFRDGSCRVTSAYAPEIFKDKSRFYKTIGDKKVYGKFSEVGKRLTVNKSGTYTGKLESLTQEELIVSITADPDNGKTVINSAILSYNTEGYDEFDTEQGIRLISYSDNERNWTDRHGEVSLDISYKSHRGF